MPCGVTASCIGDDWSAGNGGGDGVGGRIWASIRSHLVGQIPLFLNAEMIVLDLRAYKRTR